MSRTHQQSGGIRFELTSSGNPKITGRGVVRDRYQLRYILMGASESVGGWAAFRLASRAVRHQSIMAAGFESLHMIGGSVVDETYVGRFFSDCSELAAAVNGVLQ